MDEQVITERHSEEAFESEVEAIGGGVTLAISTNDPRCPGGETSLRVRWFDSKLPKGEFDENTQTGYGTEGDLEAKVTGKILASRQFADDRLVEIQKELKIIGTTSGIPRVESLTKEKERLKKPIIYAWRHVRTKTWSSAADARGGVMRKRDGKALPTQDYVDVMAFESEEAVQTANDAMKPMECRSWDGQQRQKVFDWRIIP